LPFFQRCSNGSSAGSHQSLHQNHQKSNVSLLGRQSLVVAMPDVVCDRLIQPLLRAMPGLPSNSLQPGDTRFKKGLTFCINRISLFSTNDERPNTVSADAAFVGVEKR